MRDPLAAVTHPPRWAFFFRDAACVRMRNPAPLQNRHHRARAMRLQTFNPQMTLKSAVEQTNPLQARIANRQICT